MASLPSHPGPLQQSQSSRPAADAQFRQPSNRGFKPRSFSFQSTKSFRSTGSREGAKNKTISHETSAGKESKRLHTKADPTMAVNEAEPSAVAATVKTTLASLRSIQHKDAYGNPITEPDHSNPTRNRWERPLDTIRSFEAAIDGGYNKPMARSDADSIAGYNRRSSYYANANGCRFSQESYYGSRPQSSHYDLRQGQRDSYFEQQQGWNTGYIYGGASPGPPTYTRRGYSNRMTSEPQFQGARTHGDSNNFPIPNNHRSYETVASASGSGTSGEPAGYQTDPTSSDNSSVERMEARQKRQTPLEVPNDYGIGFIQTPAYQPSAFILGAQNAGPDGGKLQQYPVGGQQNYDKPPPVPQKGVNLRKSMTEQATVANESASQQYADPEKRKSWLSRRFSKRI